MKRKTKLALAMTATLGLTAVASNVSAINLAQDGLGDFAYIPYFSVTQGQEEHIRIVNTGSKTVAAKIIFRRGTDSQEVRDFNIILSPRDVWTGVVSSAADGNAKVSTSDTTCTIPHKNQWTDEGAGVFSVDFDSTLFGNAANPPQSEGYVAVVMMGVARNDITTDTVNSIPFLAKHVGGVPRDCLALADGFAAAFSPAVGNPVPVTSQFAGTSNELSVTAAIVSADRGKAYNVPVTTIANAFTIAQVTDSANPQPNERDVDTVATIMDDNSGTATTAAYSTPQTALSAVLMRSAVIGTYDTTTNTSWVVTFPTKKAMVDPDPNLNPFKGEDADGITRVGYGTVFTDNEEGTPGIDVCPPGTFGIFPNCTTTNFSPFTPVFIPPTQQLALPHEVNVIGFGGVNPLGSSLLEDDVNTPFTEGWMEAPFFEAPGFPVISTDGATAIIGMPVIGFQYNEMENNAHSTDLSYRRIIQ